MYKGKNVIITGSVGRIGSALGAMYARHGANLILIDREENKDLLNKQMEELQEMTEHVDRYTCDLRLMSVK